jgi:hypothetical protein
MTAEPERTMWGAKRIAAELGFTEQIVKRWRGKTLDALRAADQLDWPEPTCPLPTNALPIPSNQRAHVLAGDPPRWEPKVILDWAVRTKRRHPVTGEPMRPPGTGRRPNPATQPRPVSRGRREPLTAAA